MCATAARLPETTLLFDVSRKTYEGLVDALPKSRLKLRYRDGALELFQNMFFDVSWDAYEQILKAFGERRFPHTYQDGTLEIMMSPSEDHEQIGRLLARIVELAALELGMHFKAVGSATRREKKVKHGLEPDASFYIPYLPSRSRKLIPENQKGSVLDLAIEVDIRRPGLERMQTYAQLGIRELWRYRKGTVEVFVLDSNGVYEPVGASRVFPMIHAKDLTRFVKKMQTTDDYLASRAFIAWLRKQRLK